MTSVWLVGAACSSPRNESPSQVAPSETPTVQPATDRACTPAWRPLHVPWPAGELRFITQTWEGTFSHEQQYAIDVLLAPGEPVVAADDGIVTQAIDGFADTGKPQEEYAYRSNYIELDHGNGHFSHYLHLQQGTQRVVEGQHVARGATIASSGNSGFSTQPHLHFEIVDVFDKSLPICLADVPGGAPNRGALESRNGPPGAPIKLAATQLDADALATNGITLFSPLPARIWQSGAKLRVRGRVATPLGRVAYNFQTRDRHVTVGVGHTHDADLRGHFDFAVELPSRPGRYSLTLAEQSIAKPKVIPIVVRATTASAPAPLREGPWRHAYQTGRPSDEGSYLADRPHGRWRGWFEDGRLKYEGSFDSGQLDGKWTVFFPDGSPRFERTFVKGKRDGTWREWDAAGRVAETCTFEAGTGACLATHANGEPRARQAFAGDLQHGAWTTWHDNGTRASTTSFVRGKAHGRARTWFANGRMATELVWTHGKRVSERAWHDNGQLKTAMAFRNDRVHGRVIQFHANGRKQLEVTYVGGLMHGQMTVWDDQGRLLAKAAYKAGVATQSDAYAADGNVISEP